MEQLEHRQQAGGAWSAQSAMRVSRTRFALKGLRLGLHIGGGLGLALIYPLFSPGAQRAILRRWSKTALAILNVRLDARGMHPGMEEGGMLLVANHVSWLDVVALNAVLPSSFVAKSEVQGWPVIATLCRRARTIFISRARRGDAAEASRVMAARMASGERVAVFPEGTSTDGTSVKPFYAAMFQSAIDAARPVLPVAVHYRDSAGNPGGAAPFIGDMTFVQSLTNILACESLQVILLFLQPVACTGQDRRTLAARAHAAVSPAVRNLNRVPAAAVCSACGGAGAELAAAACAGVMPLRGSAVLEMKE